MLTTLKSEIRRVVTAYCNEAEYRKWMLRALSRPGFALHPESHCRTGILTVETFRSAGGKLDDLAWYAAAAVELQMEAAFMFDHVADDELDADSGLNAAEELALAIAVLTCGSVTACEAAYRLDSNASSMKLLQGFHKSYIGACGGQFLDAHLGRQKGSSLDAALDMTSRKSGNLGRFAASFGAGVATGDPEVMELFGEFGFNLLTYMQLIDDLGDACPADEEMTDLKQMKKTVPLVYFYKFLGEGTYEDSDDIMLQLNQEPDSKIIEEFEASGARLFCAVVAEAFLNRAKGDLAELKRLSYRVDNLERLVHSLEINPKEVLLAS